MRLYHSGTLPWVGRAGHGAHKHGPGGCAQAWPRGLRRRTATPTHHQNAALEQTTRRNDAGTVVSGGRGIVTPSTLPMVPLERGEETAAHPHPPIIQAMATDAAFIEQTNNDQSCWLRIITPSTFTMVRLSAARNRFCSSNPIFMISFRVTVRRGSEARVPSEDHIIILYRVLVSMMNHRVSKKKRYL